MGFLISILILSLLIFIHELGHFLVARYFRVKVEVFSIGFGKKIYEKVYNNTAYCISLIPLGGYVKMKGQDDSNPLSKSKDFDSYTSKTPIERLCILFAGPLANIFLAFIFFLFVGLIGNRELAPIVGAVKENSPAFKSNLLPYDKILEIDNQKIVIWEDISKVIKNSEDKIYLTIERNNTIKRLSIMPQILESKNIFNETIQKKMIGISPSNQTITIEHSFIEAFPFAMNETIEAASLILLGLQKLIEGVVPVSEVGGVISIVQVTSEASNSGIVPLLILSALISVNLGILNLLPIPALDGGHIMFVLYELITKREPNENVLYKLTIVGWVILFALMLLGLFNDINRLLN